MLIEILLIILMVVFIYAVFSVLKLFVLDKIHINKWLILVIGVFLSVLPTVLRLPQNGLWMYLYMPLYVIPMMWFVSLIIDAEPKNKKEQKIKIKPKAKPNRIKDKDK